jgi:hypothetical protein
VPYTLIAVRLAALLVGRCMLQDLKLVGERALVHEILSVGDSHSEDVGHRLEQH